MQIEEYMEQLPNHKIPKIGSPGEKYRDIQLIVQLPKQDLSSEYCKSLSSEEEKKDFKEFRTFRDENVMEIGYARENSTVSSVSGMFYSFLVRIFLFFFFSCLFFCLYFCINFFFHFLLSVDISAEVMIVYRRKKMLDV